MEKSISQTNEIPTFSIVITAYNREQFISDCIESALQIDREDFEIIIVDDCSTDKTWEIIQSYSDVEGIIRAYRNETNIGQFPNRNKAASLARGRFIQFLDSDDKILHEELTEAYEIILSNNWDLCFYHPQFKAYNESPKVLLRTQLLQFPILNCGPTGMTITKTLFQRIGGFKTEFGVAGDVDFNLRAVAAAASPGIHSQEFFFYRRHEGQAINDSIDYAIYPRLYVSDILNSTSFFSRIEKRAITAAFARRFLLDLRKDGVRNQVTSWRTTWFQTLLQACFLPIRLLPRHDSLKPPRPRTSRN